MSPLRRPCLGKTRELRLKFNRAVPLQQGEVRVSTIKTTSRQYSQALLWVKQESYISTLTKSRLFNKVRATSPLNVRISSTSDEVRVPKTTTHASTRYMFSICFYKQFNNTLAKVVGNLPRFNSTPTTSSEY